MRLELSDLTLRCAVGGGCADRTEPPLLSVGVPMLYSGSDHVTLSSETL